VRFWPGEPSTAVQSTRRPIRLRDVPSQAPGEEQAVHELPVPDEEQAARELPVPDEELVEYEPLSPDEEQSLC